MKTMIKEIFPIHFRVSCILARMLAFTALLIPCLLAAQPEHQLRQRQPYTRQATTVSRPDLEANQHIIKDTLSQVTVQVVRGDRVEVQNVSVSDFRLKQDENVAVIKSTDEIKGFESKGTVMIDGSRATLEGAVLPEIYFARIKRPPSETVHPEESPSEPEQVILQILVDTLPKLQYNASNGAYEGSFFVTLLEDSKTNLLPKELEEPVSMQFSSVRAEFNPGFTAIRNTNLPSTIVQISDKSNDNPVPIRIATSFNPQGYTTYLSKQAVVRIETPERNVQGYGVQAIPVSISLLSYTGLDSVRVNLVAGQGSVEPDHIFLSSGRSGKVLLKSEGIGQATLTANAHLFTSDERNFNFVFPWMFILFSVIGGFLGALVKYLMRSEHKNLPPTLLLGCLTGFIVGILYYVIGIKLFTFEFGQLYFEFAVLGLAFLGALFWDSIYGGLSKLVVR
ncbi:MAG: hypothetical protein IH597_09540 [Bacteroidales bacterium]|nr:hypothetical protein [Bacteroidales bacterium]